MAFGGVGDWILDLDYQAYQGYVSLHSHCVI